MTMKRTELVFLANNFFPLKFQELPFLVLIIDSAFYDIDLRLLSSALHWVKQDVASVSLNCFDLILIAVGTFRVF